MRHNHNVTHRSITSYFFLMFCLFIFIFLISTTEEATEDLGTMHVTQPPKMGGAPVREDEKFIDEKDAVSMTTEGITTGEVTTRPTTTEFTEGMMENIK